MPHLIDYKNAAITATNIAQNQILFRLGFASDLLTFSVLVALIGAIFIVLRPLRPVNRNLALIASLWRLVETGVMVTVVLHSSVVLEFLNGPYRQIVTVDQLQALVLSTLRTQSDQYVIGYLFLGLGSTLFSYLWLRSGYVPRLIAWWGIIGSAICAVASMAFIILPSAASLAWYIPIGTYELVMGFWLSIRGIPLSVSNVR